MAFDHQVAHYFLERWRGSDEADRAARYQRLHGLYAPEARKVVEDIPLVREMPYLGGTFTRLPEVPTLSTKQKKDYLSEQTWQKIEARQRAINAGQWNTAMGWS